MFFTFPSIEIQRGARSSVTNVPVDEWIIFRLSSHLHLGPQFAFPQRPRHEMRQKYRQAISRLACGTVYDFSGVLAASFFVLMYQTRPPEKSSRLDSSSFHGPSSPFVTFHLRVKGLDFCQNLSWRSFFPLARSSLNSLSRSSSVGRDMTFFCASGTSATVSPLIGDMSSTAAPHRRAASAVAIADRMTRDLIFMPVLYHKEVWF